MLLISKPSPTLPFMKGGTESSLPEVPRKKRKYCSEDSKRRLMAAASDIFSKHGYDAATTKEVANKAKVNESLIHRYFKNKFGLFSAIISQFQSRLTDSLPYPPSETLESELRNFLKFRFEFAQKEKKLIHLILSRSLVDKKVGEQMRNVYQDGVPNLIQRFKQLQSEGKLRSDIPLKNVSIIVSCLSFSLNISFHILRTMDLEHSDEIIALAAQILGKGLSDS